MTEIERRLAMLPMSDFVLMAGDLDKPAPIWSGPLGPEERMS